MATLSLDLRERILAAYDAGEGSREEVAHRFRVSLGMVKKLDGDMSLTQTGHAVGTPWYMPLEQARNSKDTDRRCDIYALGCMLHALLTGQPPFAGGTIVDVIKAKERGWFPPAR